jgi:hypothetical protein
MSTLLDDPAGRTIPTNEIVPDIYHPTAGAVAVSRELASDGLRAPRARRAHRAHRDRRADHDRRHPRNRRGGHRLVPVPAGVTATTFRRPILPNPPLFRS